MAAYTQVGQPARVDTIMGPDALLLDSYQGVEGISVPFVFQLSLVSTREDIDPVKMLRSKISITTEIRGGTPCTIHGLVSRFVQAGQSHDLTSYRAEMVPWLWFLSLSRESRIYQKKNVPDIIKAVFAERGYADFKINLQGTFEPRDYCVQYRETHLNFVSRLMEEEGIFYYFEHQADKHVMVITNVNSSAKDIAGVPTIRVHRQPVQDEDVIWSLERENSVHAGKVTLRDYSFEMPSTNLERFQAGQGIVKEEVYDYPGKYNAAPQKMHAEGLRLARIQLEAEEVLGKVVRGQSNAPTLRSGAKLAIAGHFRRDLNEAYLLVQVRHSMHGGGYRSWNNSTPMDYHNDFVSVPFATPYRAPCRAQKAIVHGEQTAVVVGPAGEEIWTDKYGQVKVQFYWDRVGTKDDNSSCWCRVSSNWAGKQWGAIQLPRIGQEVIVSFLEGDPDRPIITGRVYNAEQMPPYTLPANQTMSGTKSRSSKGAATDNFNEIRMEDKKGSEQLFIHAEKNQDIEVENDETHWVGHDQTNTIDNDRTEQVKHNESITVDNDQMIAIGKNRTESVQSNESVTVGENRTVSIGKNDSLDVAMDRTATIGANETISISGARTTSVSKDDALSVGKKLTITAADEITIKTGDASIVMKKDGTITIKGKDIKIEGSGKINAKASGDITLKGSTIKQN